MLKSIKNTTQVTVRFSECDALKMVWHGNYAKYFEDGREDFGKKYGFTYMEIFEKTGLAVPLVHLSCDYKKMVSFGEILTVETILIDDPAAKIVFEYNVFDSQNQLVCKGTTTQIFINMENRELMITTPLFIENWKNIHFAE